VHTVINCREEMLW